MKEYFVTVEVRLVVKAADEVDAKFKAASYVAAGSIHFGTWDVEFSGKDIVCCTEETTNAK